MGIIVHHVYRDVDERAHREREQDVSTGGDGAAAQLTSTENASGRQCSSSPRAQIGGGVARGAPQRSVAKLLFLTNGSQQQVVRRAFPHRKKHSESQGSQTRSGRD